MDKRIKAWMPSIIWAFIISIASFVSPEHYPRVDVRYADKFMHLVMYGIFALIVSRSVYISSGMTFPFKGALFTLILCFGYGILMELVQWFIPGRNASLTDIAANALGTILGVVLGGLIVRGGRWLK